MDTIGNLLTSIRNGYLAKKTTIEVPYSKINEGLVKIFSKHGFVSAYTKSEDRPVKLTLTLHYFNQQPVLTHLERVSKPGVRVYLRASEIVVPKSGVGFSLLSTSKGFLTDREAKSAGLGGEVICRVW